MWGCPLALANLRGESFKKGFDDVIWAISYLVLFFFDSIIKIVTADKAAIPRNRY